ncbi:MAG: type IV pilus twitching motility protein PilT [Phycisphaeraceae bacterium]|nr:type IV pilus twitching motility protein PilT [Phycisphaeraceae bacterium]
MSDLARKVFKLIVVHNKLLSEKDLNFFFTSNTTPQQCIERLVVSNMIPQDVGQKLEQVFEAKLAKEIERLAIAQSVGGGLDEEELIEELIEEPEEELEEELDDDGDAPVPIEDPKDDGMDPGGSSYELAGDLGIESDLNKSDEVGWGDEAAVNHDEMAVHHIDDSERIELSDEVSPQKLIKGFDEGLSELAADSKKAKPQHPKPSLPASEISTAADPTPSHLVSPVAPGQIDPVAMKLLKKGVKLNCSDIHMASGSPPFFRINGSLAYTELPALTPDRALVMVMGFMNESQQQQFLRTNDIDFSLDFEGTGRFRVNALQHFRGPSIIFRYIPRHIPTLEELGLPQTLARFTEYHQGLVLITGPAGCGKTTTAAALIDLINVSRQDHIITVEDPVEFLQPSKGCNVTQRQVPIHTDSFAAALKAALREDPDVIMIGEMRDLETVSLAIRAAETGHLVIGTLQTKSAARTIDRIIDVFPEDQQAQIRSMLSESLRGVISQSLIPRKDGKGRVVALEVLNVVNSVSNLIRDSKTYQLPSLMQTGRKQGQVMMDDSLNTLIEQGLITKEEALKATENPKRFK